MSYDKIRIVPYDSILGTEPKDAITPRYRKVIIGQNQYACELPKTQSRLAIPTAIIYRVVGYFPRTREVVIRRVRNKRSIERVLNVLEKEYR